MNYPLSRIIRDHQRLSGQRGGEPGRTTEVWASANHPSGLSVSTLVVTARDLHRCLFGDCIYSLFSAIPGLRTVNEFQLPKHQHRDLVGKIQASFARERRAARGAFRTLSPEQLALLSAVAYDLTAARVWTVKRFSLDPVYSNKMVSTKNVLVLSRTLAPFLIKDLVDIVLAYAVDVCRPNDKRCGHETKEGGRCNRAREESSVACRLHRGVSPSLLLANHYLF